MIFFLQILENTELLHPSSALASWAFLLFVPKPLINEFSSQLVVMRLKFFACMLLLSKYMLCMPSVWGCSIDSQS